jgi:hypothetical protein
VKKYVFIVLCFMSLNMSASDPDNELPEDALTVRTASLLAMASMVLEVQQQEIDSLKEALNRKNLALEYARDYIDNSERLLAQERAERSQLEDQMRLKGLPVHGYNLRKRK